MKPELEVVSAALAADIPVLIWGPPGTGKTATIIALAAAAGAHLETLIGSTIDPTDLARPVIGSDGEVRLSAAPWARRICKLLDSDTPVWLFLDELSCVPPSVQAALLRVVQERVVGEVDISGCRFLAAANPIDQAAGGWDLAAATANRWTHVDWRLDYEEWVAGELGGWGKSRSESQSTIAALVASFINHRPQALLDCPTDPVMASRGWPSPSAWSNVIKLLGAMPTDSLPAQSAAGRLAMIGLVGEGVVREFSTWVVDQDLPHPSDILSGKCKLPTRGDRQRAAVEGVIAFALNRSISSDCVLKVISKTRKDVRIALGKAFLQAASVAKKEISFSKEFDEMIAEIRGLSTLRAKAKVAYSKDT